MLANAQRDGRRVEYRWRPLFNAAVWLTPTTSSAATGRLLTYLSTTVLTNTSVTNHRNQIVYVKIIASQRWDVF